MPLRLPGLCLLLFAGPMAVGARGESVTPIAVFGNSRGDELVFATGETDGARTAAVMAEIPAVDGTRKHIVVIFDGQHWPAFEGMWHKARDCLAAMQGTPCPPQAIDDSLAGTAVSIFIDTDEEVVRITLADKSGGHAEFPFADDNPVPLKEIGAAVEKISHYLALPAASR